MTKQEAIKIVEDMPENEFQDFFKSLPMRTQLCVKGGLVDWRECLAYWYVVKHHKKYRLNVQQLPITLMTLRNGDN